MICETVRADPAHIADPPIELRVYFPDWDGQSYDSDSAVEEYAAKRTGVSLRSIQTKPGQLPRQRMIRLIRSAKLPDIVGGADVQRLFNKYGPQGAFIRLDELLSRHAPNLTAFFNANPDLYRAAMAHDHHLYFIPYFPEGDLSTGYFIRKDWLDRLGLEVPQTARDFHEVLLAFRTRDPNGNGQVDEIPFFAQDLVSLLHIAPLWDARSSGSDHALDFHVKGNELVHGLAQPEFREVISNLAQWYREGLFNPEILDGVAPERTTVLQQDRVGALHDLFGPTASYNDSLVATIPGFELIPIAPPASASGRRMEEGSRRRILPTGWAISFRNPYPVETLRYFDFWFSEEGRRLQNFGIEGVHYDMIDGMPILRPEVLGADRPVIEQLRAAGAALPRGGRQDFDQEWQAANAIARQGIQLYRDGYFLPEPFYPSALTQEEQTVIDLHLAQVTTYMLLRIKNWIRGEGDVHAEWEGYLRELDDLGLAKVIGALNSARWRDLYDK